MSSARPSRIDKSFYRDSNLQDRKQKGRPQNCSNDQSKCSSQFTFGAPVLGDAESSKMKKQPKSNSGMGKQKTHNKLSGTSYLASTVQSQTDIPSLDLNSSSEQQECHYDYQDESERGSVVSELSNDPYHRTLTPLTPIPAEQFPKHTQTNWNRGNLSARHSNAINEPRSGSGTPRPRDSLMNSGRNMRRVDSDRSAQTNEVGFRWHSNNAGGDMPQPVPSMPARLSGGNVKEAWNERSVKFSSASPDVRVMSGRGDSECTDSARSWSKSAAASTVKNTQQTRELDARFYQGLVAPYGTSSNNGYTLPSTASPTKKMSYRKRNESNIFG